MVKHIVMWKMKKDKGSAQSAMNALEIKKKLERLTSTIIEIKDLEVGSVATVLRKDGSPFPGAIYR